MKVAACLHDDPVRAVEVVRRMCEAQRLFPEHRVRLFPIARGALGAVLTSDQAAPFPLLHEGPTGSVLLVSGVPVSWGDPLPVRLASAASGHHAEATAILRDLDGPFAALYWDPERDTVAIVTDLLAFQPLYVARTPEALLLASELRAFPASGLIPVRMDLVGWGSFIAAQASLLGSHSLLEGVQPVEPGSTILIDAATRAACAAPYWRWPEPRPDLTLDHVDTGELVDLLARHLERLRAYAEPGTLLLSGGFDSRLLLCLLDRAGLEPHLVIHELPDAHRNAEARYALAAARLFARRAELVWSDPDFYASGAYADYLVMSEVSTKSLPLFIARLPSAFRPAWRAVWDGLGPGMALSAALLSPVGFEAFLRDRVEARGSATWEAARRVLAPGLADRLHEAFTEAFTRERRRYRQDEFGVREFTMRNRVRSRHGTQSLKVYPNLVLPLTPGLSRRLFDVTARIPSRIKADYRLYLRLYQRHFPRALAVPWYGSGVPRTPAGRLSPAQWLYTKGKKRRDLVRRLAGFPGIESVARRAFRVENPGTRRSLAGRVVHALDLDHPDVNPDAVRALQRSERPEEPTTRAARELLFYWQTWRWIMSGKLTMPRPDTTLDQLLERR